jgi:hypothetical protein
VRLRLGVEANIHVWSVLRFLVGATAAFLLTSFGGAQIAAAPLSIPALLWAIGTSRSRTARVLLSLIAIATAQFVGWWVVYVTIGEQQPWVWVGPLLAAVLALCLCALVMSRFPRVRAPVDDVAPGVHVPG